MLWRPEKALRIRILYRKDQDPRHTIQSGNFHTEKNENGTISMPREVGSEMPLKLCYQRAERFLRFAPEFFANVAEGWSSEAFRRHFQALPPNDTQLLPKNRYHISEYVAKVTIPHVSLEKTGIALGADEVDIRNVIPLDITYRDMGVATVPSAKTMLFSDIEFNTLHPPSNLPEIDGCDVNREARAPVRERIVKVSKPLAFPCSLCTQSSKTKSHKTQCAFGVYYEGRKG